MKKSILLKALIGLTVTLSLGVQPLAHAAAKKEKTEGRKLASFKTLTTIYFGKDGVDQEFPAKGASENAKEVFEALGGGDHQIKFDGETYSYEINSKMFQLTLADDAGEVKPNNKSKKKANLSISGVPARDLFDRLPESAGSGKVGVNAKKVANISCIKVMGRGFPVTCRFKDVAITTIDAAE